MPVEFARRQHETEQITAHVIWMTTGLGCDGDSVGMTSATNPSLEDIITGAIPGMPKVIVHNPVLAFEQGDEFMQAWYDAEAGKLDPFVLILEGSLPNEKLSGDGYFAAMGNNHDTGQPITTTEWIDRLAPKAAAVVAVGTCATYGGIPAMKNNPTGAMGLWDHLGHSWKSKAGIPIVNTPGCPAQPDNITETLMYLCFALVGRAPVPELDDVGRPKWLFERTTHESCNRAAFYEEGDFAKEYGSHKCLVKLGCKGPVVKCNVPLRGWVNGIGGCPNVGGICMACWSIRSGDAEFRPVGSRRVWLDELRMTDEQWAAFGIPIGLAFFMISSVTGGVIALYPSPAGATESELDLRAWASLCETNPELELEPDTEALIVNRLGDEPQQMIAPIDAAHGLVGVVKTSWEGITGGAGVPAAVSEYLESLRARPAVGA